MISDLFVALFGMLKRARSKARNGGKTKSARRSHRKVKLKAKSTLRISRNGTSKKPAKRKRAAHVRPGATVADILGIQKAATEPVKPKWRKHYRRLTELRSDLLKRRINRSQESMEEQPTFSTHMADAGTDSYDRDFSLGVLSFEQDALFQIDQALDRIRSGTYGICELTGKPIEPERLEAIPWSRFSLAAEKQMEAEGAFKLGRIGDRRSVAREEATPEPEEE